MQEYLIGEVLRKRRLELGLTQAELCEGICEPSTLSRIENGSQTPCRRKLIVLLQRLGLPENRYYALIDNNEVKISELQAQINASELTRNFEKGLGQIATLEKIISNDDVLSQQFIIRAKAAFGVLQNNQIVPYPFEEKLQMLFTALYLTIPHFDLNKIEEGLYGIEELKIISQIALAYSDAGQRALAINIYHQLVNYIHNHLSELYQIAPVAILIYYNYSRTLCFEKRFYESIAVGTLGLDLSLKTRHSTYLGNLLFYVAYCSYELGQFSKSRDYFRFSYFAHRLMSDNINMARSQRALEELFNTTIDY